MPRTPLWVFALLVLVIVGLGVYAYFTTPLPFGLSSVVRTPGGANLPPAAPSTPPGTHVAAGQALQLGSTSVVVSAVQRDQDLSTGGRGPAGLFTLVQLDIQNDGSESLVPQPTDFKLIDERGRDYAVDVEATRVVNAAAKRRAPFESTVPPGGRGSVLLAFETAPNTNVVGLHVSLGSGDLDLPR